MRANEFITEEEVSPYHYYIFEDVEEAANAFRQKCDPAILHRPLWRGMRNHEEPFLELNPGSGIRKSENTSNHYTVLMDTSPYLTKYPKRSNSLICTTDHDGAASYAFSNAGVYALFTFKGTPVGVCPKDDIWRTPFDISDDFREIGMYEISSFERTFEELLLPQDVNIMKQTIADPQWQERYMRIFYKKVKPADLINYFYKKLSPKSTGFTLHTQSTLSSMMNQSHECWFSGKCIAIHEPQLENFIDEVRHP